MSSSTELLLEFRNWRVCFQSGAENEVVAVNDLSFTLQQGESLGLVGESGSGKSITALSAIQLLPQAAEAQGEIIWKGEELLSTLPAADLQQLRARKIGMIFQEPLSSLNPLICCGHQLLEPLLAHLQLDKKAAEAAAKKWFSKVGLRDPERIFQSYPHQLSGGQRQRVMIAMALCTEPELLIADEPTTALDVTVQKGILELIQQLQQELGLAVLFISHDLGVIREITDKVLVMWKGQVVESGEVGQVLDHPQHPYTKGLVACRPGVAGGKHRLPTVPDFLDRQPEEVNTHLKALEEAARERQLERLEKLTHAPLCLEVEDLSVRYTKKRNWLGQVTDYHQAVDGVSLSLRQGECLGVVGESGSGKTTLGKALVRLVNLQAGKIAFAGQQIEGLSEREFRPLRPKIQMVFQDPFSSLNPKLTIEALLTEPLRIHAPHLNREARLQRVLEVLTQVGLDHSALERFPKAFSGGQRQRIGIARALLFEPEVLICDESVSALDVSVQAQVLNLLKRLQTTYEFSMIFISHDLGVIRFIADRVLVMQHGEVVEQGSAEQLFTAPQKEYTQALLSAVLR